MPSGTFFTLSKVIVVFKVHGAVLGVLIPCREASGHSFRYIYIYTCVLVTLSLSFVTGSGSILN